MKEIVSKYLSTNYRFSVKSLKDYQIYDIKHQKFESLQSVFKLLLKVFALTSDELEEIVNPWVEEKATELNNRIVDIQYKIFQATGVEIKLTTDQLIQMIEDENSGFNHYYLNPNEIAQQEEH